MTTVVRAAIPLDELTPEQIEMARQRPNAMSKALKHISDEVYLSHDDPFIDFSSAGLYLVGLQTTVATVACSATSIASCWLLPGAMVSAVRTLAITCLVGFVCMRKPIRVGRVRGVTTIFNALRPCLVIYICALTIEQLVHTCVVEGHRAPNYTRRIVFHSMISVIAAAGFWRAAKPLSESDGPFMVSAFAIVVIAVLPPPATPLSGPLCEAASLFNAGDRLLRAFLFASLYVIHVYCSPPQRNSIHDLAVCIMRCAAAAVWVLGCHVFVVWVPIIQAIVALWARFGTEPSSGNYSNIDTRSDSGLSDAELGVMSDMQLPRGPDGVLIAPYMRDPLPGTGRSNGYSHMDMSSVPSYQAELERNDSPPAAAPQPSVGTITRTTPSPSVAADGVPVDPRQLSALVGNGGSAMSKARMAEIAASM